jgi:hypothetical protein
MTQIEAFWKEFKNQAFPDVEDHKLAPQRGVFFAGVVCTISHLTSVRDPDAVLGRLGELVKALEESAAIEVKAIKEAQRKNPDCYDGSHELSD